ncbi:MAG: hypothetical protein C5B58_08260 [Acidobacteria bacterium]|nr:MAG: hypothetical protein C5B58_08260 [Acidobacteriota bacterium]
MSVRAPPSRPINRLGACEFQAQLTKCKCQALCKRSDIDDRGIGRSYGVDDAALVGDVQLHPELPVAALFGLLHLGSPVALAFLFELGAAMMVASTMARSAAAARALRACARSPRRSRWSGRSAPADAESAGWWSHPAPRPRSAPPARSAAS